MKEIVYHNCFFCGYAGPGSASDDGTVACPQCGKRGPRPRAKFDFNRVGPPLLIFGVLACALAAARDGSDVAWMLLILLGLILYFIPTFVAHRRIHRNFSGIVILNLFLGWTLLGWVGALIWAMYEERR